MNYIRYIDNDKYLSPIYIEFHNKFRKIYKNLDDGYNISNNIPKISDLDGFELISPDPGLSLISIESLDKSLHTDRYRVVSIKDLIRSNEILAMNTEKLSKIIKTNSIQHIGGSTSIFRYKNMFIYFTINGTGSTIDDFSMSLNRDDYSKYYGLEFLDFIPNLEYFLFYLLAKSESPLNSYDK